MEESQDLGPAPGGDAAKSPLEEAIIQGLGTVYDPEIPVSIYELGLIYDIDTNDDGDVVIAMTLTSPACPVAESLPGEVESTISAIDGVKSVKVNLVWEPTWSMEKMSEAARLELGFM